MFGLMLGVPLLFTFVGYVVDHPFLLVAGVCSTILNFLYGHKAYDKFKFEKDYS